MQDPIMRFAEWLELAKANPAISEPTAMALATAGSDGAPSVRMVLLKQADARGFVFYTNFEGRKSREIRENPRVALCFYWPALERQVRVEGVAEPVSAAEADAYFAGRPRISQLGAWSRQSEVLADHTVLERMVAEKSREFDGKIIPRPAHWSGWRVAPERVEFWQQGEFRLHDRDLYSRSDTGWEMCKLYP